MAIPERDPGLSRRAALHLAATGGVGLVAGGPPPACGADPAAAAASGTVAANEAWFAERAWALSGNKVLASDGPPTASRARRIEKPRSAAEIADLVKTLPATTPLAVVCGGHESSNAATLASREAIVLDLGHLKSIEFHADGAGTLVTVGAGVVFRELVAAVKEQHGALPVGTGPGVGVVGYLVNGGLSGYFSRRLGLLGQRVERMTVVTPAGDVRVVTAGDQLLTAMLGAGSALAIVVDVTLRLAPESVVRGAEQRVFGFETRQQAVDFSRGALRFLRDHALPDESVSMELVVSGPKALVVTVVFYDSFTGDTAAFIKPLEDLAAGRRLPLLATSHHGSWYETAAALWPVINGIKGHPLATLQHCVGTKGPPADAVLDFIADTLVARAPLDEAVLSLVEMRTLGGAAQSGPRLPTGNCHHAFFVDLVVMYDARGKTGAERQAIVDITRDVIDRARAVEGLSVDFSGTHSQPDDVDRTAVAAVIFGTEALAESVRALKRRFDPDNRLRFHPFAKFL